MWPALSHGALDQLGWAGSTVGCWVVLWSCACAERAHCSWTERPTFNRACALAAQVEKCKVPVPKRGAPAPPAAAAAPPAAAPAPAAVPAPSPSPVPEPAPVSVAAPAPAVSKPAAPAASTPGEAYNVAYVGNVAFEASDEELLELFKAYGANLVRLHKDKATGKSKGFAHVHFPDADSLKR